ncbi:hypothetical protein HS125_17560 [bacterium]|nr:hypothetical protein [bacterium]
MSTATRIHSGRRAWAAALILFGLLWAPLWGQTPEGASVAANRKDLGPQGDIIIDSLNFSDAPLQGVLRGIAKFSNLNIAVGPEVQGSATVYFENVRVKDALETVLRLNNLSYIVSENIVVVLPAARLGEERAILDVDVITPQYLSVGELEAGLKELKTSQGTISVNEESNSVVVQDTPQGIAQLRRVLAAMDRPRAQVNVEAHLVEITLGDNLDLGIDWGFVKATDSGDRLSLTGDSNLGRALTAPANRLLSGGSLDFGYTRGFGSVTGFLNALSQKTSVKVLQNPNIIVLDNKTNSIDITNQIPFVETNVSQGVITESVQFMTVGIKLLVTPHITEDDHVVMHTLVDQSIAGPRVTLGNSNAFDVQRRKAENDLIVLSGQTVAVGGLVNTNLSRSYDKVPILGDVPLVGPLFKKKSTDEERTELILFLTPTVIREHQRLTPRQETALAEFGPALSDFDALRDKTYEYQQKERQKRAQKAEKARLAEIEAREKAILAAEEEARRQSQKQAEQAARQAEKAQKEAEKAAAQQRKEEEKERRDARKEDE